jgi:hypothetical protein
MVYGLFALEILCEEMLRAIAAAHKKSNQTDANNIADCLRYDFLRGAT